MNRTLGIARQCALAVVIAGCRIGSAPAPDVPETGAYVMRLGSDTVAIDSYTRFRDRIEGRLLTRYPRTVVSHYTVILDAAGRPTRHEQQVRLPNGSLLPNVPRAITVRYTTDSVVAEVQRDTTATIRVPAREAFPFQNFAVSLYALPIAALNAMPGRDSTTFVTYNAGAARASALPIARKGPNRYWVYVFGAPQEVVTDAAGRVISVDATRTTIKFQTTRQASADVPALATVFAQREAAARPAAMSPRDTVDATIGSAQLWVDYSRPSARGRRVFGQNGVLGDTLWRTGANAATQFRTTVPIVVAGQTIPAGTYTLWTRAVPGRYQLIFNRQTGQWGTAYDPAQDLVRVPLQASRLAQPVDRFTIAVEPTGGSAGIIRLQWDTTELAVPFTVP